MTRLVLMVYTPTTLMARPRADVSPEQVEELAAILCTLDEMSAVLGCDKSTLHRRFAKRIEKGRERGKQSLRRAQWHKAHEGNVAMLIWLGKQHLGQRDKLDTVSDQIAQITVRYLDQPAHSDVTIERPLDQPQESGPNGHAGA